jgi:hypothetical protein
VPFGIATGTYTSADALMPLLESGSGVDALAGITPIASAPDPSQAQGGVADITGQQQERDSSGAAAAAAAQHAGMAAEDGRRQHYAAQQVPVGGSIGDAMDLPVVPAAAVPPAMSDEYPWGGQEPTPAGAGFASTSELPAG